MIVVSEIGEQWSPQTEPARAAEMQMKRSSSGSPGRTVTIGMRIPNVPQDVPVENARKLATMNIIAGRNAPRLPAEPFIASSKNPAALSSPVVIFLSAVANVRIVIAGTIALNPLGMQFIASLKEITLLQSMYTIVTIRATREPRGRPTVASVLPNAPIKSPL